MPDRRPLSRLLPRQREGLPDVAVIRSGRLTAPGQASSQVFRCAVSHVKLSRDSLTYEQDGQCARC